MSLGGDALKGAGSGAAAGSAFGPWGAAIGAGVGAIGSIAGNLIQGNASKKNAEQQQKYNLEILAKQNQYNTEMFNAANEWNSPVNERKRLEAAGINPLQLTGDAGEATPMQSASALGYQQPMAVNPFAGAVESFNAIRATDAQIENLQASTAKMNEEKLSEVQKRENLKVEYNKIVEEANSLKASANLSGKYAEQVDKILEWADRLNDMALRQGEADINLKKSTQREIDELLEGKKLIQSKTIEDFDRRWKQIDAAIANLAADTSLKKKDLENYVYNHLDSGVFGSGVSLKNMFVMLDEFIKGITGVLDSSYSDNPDEEVVGHGYRSEPKHLKMANPM